MKKLSPIRTYEPKYLLVPFIFTIILPVDEDDNSVGHDIAVLL
jgi:hypothetical protein